MPDYKYINVRSPDRGVDKNVPACDLSPRQASDCSNVWFDHGELRKRFGYGQSKPQNTGTSYIKGGEEIAHMVVFDQAIGDTEPTRRLLAFTANFQYEYDATNDEWDYKNLLSWEHTFDSVTNVTAANAVIDRSAGGFANNTTDSIVMFSALSSGSAETIVVTIAANGTPDTFTWTGGDGPGGPTNLPDPVTGSENLAAAPACNISGNTTTGFTVAETFTVEYTTATTIALHNGPAPEPIKGSGCLKVTIPAGTLTKVEAGGDNVTTAIIAVFKDETGTNDLKNARTVTMWVYSDTAFNRTSLTLFMFADNTKKEEAIGLFYANAPGHQTIAANTWTQVTFDFSNANIDTTTTDWDDANYMAIGLRKATVTALAMTNIYFDDIRVSSGGGFGDLDTKKNPMMSETSDAAISSSTGQRLYLTSLDTHVRYVDTGSSVTIQLLNADDYNTSREYHQCRALSYFGNHLNLLGTVEEDTGVEKFYLQRVRFSDLNDLDVWDTGTSGNTKLPDTDRQIQTAAKLGGNNYIFKDDEIIRQTHLGGQTGIYGYQSVYQEDGALAPKLVAIVQDFIYFAGQNNIYRWNAASRPQRIGDPIKEDFFTDINYDEGQYYRRSHMLYIEPRNLLGIGVPAASEFPDKFYVLDAEEDTWCIWDFSAGESKDITAGTSYDSVLTTKWNQQVQFGTSEGEFHQFGLDEKNDGSEPISAFWDSKDFSAQDNDGPAEYTLWKGVYVEAKGDNLTVSYSVDDGQTWTEIREESLQADEYRSYYFSIDVESIYCRVRFSDDNLDSTFTIRRFSLRYTEGSPG